MASIAVGVSLFHFSFPGYSSFNASNDPQSLRFDDSQICNAPQPTNQVLGVAAYRDFASCSGYKTFSRAVRVGKSR